MNDTNIQSCYTFWPIWRFFQIRLIFKNILEGNLLNNFKKNSAFVHLRIYQLSEL